MLDEYEEEEMAVLTESVPLVGNLRNSIQLGTERTPDKEMTVQDVLDKASFSMLDVMYLIALGLIGIADSMQACYIAIVLPVLK